jgi:outer membrane murein-binding lipoprotein Lpp
MAAMSFRARPLCAILVASLVAGCGGGHDATEKQLEEFRAQVSRLKSEQAALGERLERAEIALRARPSEPARAPLGGQGDRGDRPALDVVRLEPGRAPALESDDPDADTPRPLVRASGNSGVIQDTTSGKVLLDDRGGGEAAPKKKPAAFGAPGSLGAAKGGATRGGPSPAGERKP